MSSNWINHTKEFSQKNNVNYKEALSNPQNRMQYYDTQIDRSKFNRVPHMLQPDHPAMQPYIQNSNAQQQKIINEITIQTKRHMAGKTIKFKK